jgi:hypothetical protein
LRLKSQGVAAVSGCVLIIGHVSSTTGSTEVPVVTFWLYENWQAGPDMRLFIEAVADTAMMVSKGLVVMTVSMPNGEDRLAR